MANTVFSNSRAMEMAQQLMLCKSMAAVVMLLRTVAHTLPVTKPGASKKKRNRKASRRAGQAVPRGWREEMLLLADYLERGETRYSIFAMHGNMKLPFVAFSVLPFVTCPGMGECAKFCYSRKAWRTPGGFLRQFQNTALLMFNRRAVITAFKALPEGITFRLYVDGDFDSMSTMQFWFNLLAQRPDIDCYGYSKSWELLLAWDRPFPDNYAMNLSSGSKYDNDAGMVERVMQLAVARNWFIVVDVDKKFMRKDKGYDRYADPEYHRAVRDSARKLGHLKVLSCTGNCGACVTYQGVNAHACGAKREDGTYVFDGVVANGNHG
jgi:ferredoxin